ncbi:hypothetical protein B1C78_11020 [Thioalkalivibrio denitrificans]|uniref:Uncharacterized protein n=1 Tax=Thioalkalivibrio denitrificans TaxID=108003 RepID=A0A1V3NEK2_9GAMM|nr:hypothetical protein [Thioalkalivibrio denitrificans]OOG23539.1 hypothetical protein B1C78_11020 [Thioalkalivibrio denitrificans]
MDTAVGFRLALPGNVERVIDGGAALIFIYPDARSVTLVSTFENDLSGWFEGKDTSLAEFVRMVFDPSTPVDIPLGDVAQEMRDALLHGETRVLRYSTGPVEIHRLMFTEDPTRGLRERAFVTSDTVPHAQLEISAEGISTKEFEEILSSLGTWN